MDSSQVPPGGGASAAGDGDAGPRPWLVLVGAGVAVLVVVAAIIGFMRRDDPPGGAKVAVVGDSVTFQSAGALEEAFDWTGNLNVQGRPGLRTDELLPVARDVVGASPDILVVMPGYNDVLQGVDTADAVAQMVDLAAEVPCAVWMLLPTKGGYPAADVEAYNDRVEDLAADHDTLHIDTGWRDRADDTDTDEPDPELVSTDLVHPTTAGTRAIAEAVEAAVSRHCG